MSIPPAVNSREVSVSEGKQTYFWIKEAPVDKTEFEDLLRERLAQVKAALPGARIPPALREMEKCLEERVKSE